LNYALNFSLVNNYADIVIVSHGHHVRRMIELCTGVDVHSIELCSVTKLTPMQHSHMNGDLLAYHVEYANSTSHLSPPATPS
jgi:broad specificity phosphatase PhoE